MAKGKRRSWKGALATVGIVLLGAVALVLLYALVSRFVTVPVNVSRTSADTELVGEILQIEVRNAAGVSGLAGEMTVFLRKQGFDVVETGDHSRFDLPQTLVLDRVGDPAAALRIATALGLSETSVRAEPAPDAYVDATILIGNDYQTLPPFEKK